MRICQLVPGSGGTFYCQNCLRDQSLLRALQRAGHDVMMVPLYLPLFDESDSESQPAPVFFGGINVYLQQRFPLFRSTPRWLDRIFDTPLMLKLAASQAGSTNAAKLGPMTLSMLEGRHGHQRKEFERLIAWFAHQEKPDVVHISNALLLGFAAEVKNALGVPIVCSLQDEEPWIEAMPEPWRTRCWERVAACAAYVDAFIAPSAWYAGRMAERMHLSKERIQVVHLGTDVEDAPQPPAADTPPTLGFLSRLTEATGLGVLMNAFIALKQESALKDLRLRATGGFTAADRPFLDAIQAQLRQHGFVDAVDFEPDFQGAQRAAFLRSVNVFATPAPDGEAFGVQLIEAMAQGVPVVQPRTGAYPEIVEASGGGLLYDAADKDGLKNALRTLLLNPETARALGRQGQKAVRERFHIEKTVENLLRVYQALLD